jgi:hypothetical protein
LAQQHANKRALRLAEFLPLAQPMFAPCFFHKLLTRVVQLIRRATFVAAIIPKSPNAIKTVTVKRITFATTTSASRDAKTLLEQSERII